MATMTALMADELFQPRVGRLGLNHTVSTEMDYSIEDMTERLHVMYRLDDRYFGFARNQAQTAAEIRQVADDAAEKIRDAVMQTLVKRNARIFGSA